MWGIDRVVFESVSSRAKEQSVYSKIPVELGGNGDLQQLDTEGHVGKSLAHACVQGKTNCNATSPMLTLSELTLLLKWCNEMR